LFLLPLILTNSTPTNSRRRKKGGSTRKEGLLLTKKSFRSSCERGKFYELSEEISKIHKEVADQSLHDRKERIVLSHQILTFSLIIYHLRCLHVIRLPYQSRDISIVFCVASINAVILHSLPTKNTVLSCF